MLPDSAANSRRNRRSACSRIASADKPVNLEAVRLFAVILAPCRFLREADQVRAGDMMVMADLAPAHAGEKRLGVVGVDARPAGCRLPDG